MSLAAVHGALLAEGGLLADALGPAPAEEGALGAAAASGPRWNGREADIAFVVEAIREGELLHYGAPRLFDAIDPDLGLAAVRARPGGGGGAQRAVRDGRGPQRLGQQPALRQQGGIHGGQRQR